MIRTDASGVACCGNCGSHLEVICTGGCKDPDVVFAENAIATMRNPSGPRHAPPPPPKTSSAILQRSLVAETRGRTVTAIYGLARYSAVLCRLSVVARVRTRAGFAAETTSALSFRFQQGHVPANKGLRRPGYAPGRMKETQFKKGQPPSNKRELGDLRLNADGYVDMKVCLEPGAHAWRALHVVLWEDAHGPVPRGYALAFKDRDKLNVDLDNLELISRADLCRRNSIHNLPPAIKGAITVLGALKRRINREEQHRGSAKPFVRNPRRPARQRAAAGH